MRVLRIIARLNVGGPAQHVVWLHEGLSARGHECLLVTGVVPATEEDMSGFAAEHGVTPLVIPSMSRELSPLDAINIWRVWRLMRKFRPDVVHTHTAKAGAVGRIAGLFHRGARFVHTYHGHVFHSYYGRWKTRLFLLIERFLARFATDKIVVLSEQQLREIRDDFRIGRAEQFAVIPLGIDLAPFALAPRAPTDKLTVGIVGRVTAIKNHDLFMRVAHRLREDARFVVYGDGDLRRELEARAGNVEFAGTHAPRDVYAALDIVALTSRNEGTPLALIEAMACSKPIVSTAVGGVVDLLGDVVERHERFDVRERGITAESGDEEGLTAALAFLIKNQSLRNRFAERGRLFVESRHSKERLLADILDLYQQLDDSHS